MNSPKITLAAAMFIITMLATGANAQWSMVPSSPDSYFDDIYNDNGTLYLADYNNGVYRSTDSAQTWDHLTDGLSDWKALRVYQIYAKDMLVLIATEDGIYKSVDRGDHWYQSSEGIFIGDGTQYLSTISIFEYNGALLVGSHAGIFRSTDWGDSWSVTNVQGRDVWSTDFVDHNGVLFVASNNINFPYMYISSDSGQTWELFGHFLSPPMTFYSDSDNLWAGTITGAWVFLDGALTWEHRSNGMWADPNGECIIKVNGSLLIGLNGSGVFRSSNDGLWWEEFSEGFSNISELDKMIIYDDKILAVTSDGLWQRDTLDIATGIEDHVDALPESYSLAQNYPNPFNASTSISYNLPHESEVNISIYDITGRMITTLENGVVPAGEHAAVWNTGNISSGVYFYKIQADSYAETKRMVLLK